MSNTQEQVVISIRIDKETKDRAAEVFEAMGMDLSSGIKLFLNNVITEGALGFTPMTEDGLKFRYYKEYKKKLARMASFQKAVGDANDPSIDWKD